MGRPKGQKLVRKPINGQLVGYTYRLFPDAQQVILLNKNIGHTRFVYNWALETRQEYYHANHKTLSRSDLSSMLPQLKEQTGFLDEANSQTLQQALLNLDKAYTNFFKGRSKFPKRKNRGRNDSCYYPAGVQADQETGKIYLPKFNNSIKYDNHRQFDGKVKSATITRSASGKYFVSLLVDDKKKETLPETRNSIGIDFGLISFIATSDGDKIESPKFLRKKEKALARSQRNMARKAKGSKNRNKARIKVAKIHEKIANQRKDFLHKLSDKITNENDIICVEDLNIKGMMKMRSLAKSASDAGWGMFVNFLKYKSEWKGRDFRKIDRWEKTTGRCWCGYKTKLELQVRKWTCPECGSIHDRDIQAAKMIQILGLGLPEVTSVEILPLLNEPNGVKQVRSRKQKTNKKQLKKTTNASSLADYNCLALEALAFRQG